MSRTTLADVSEYLEGFHQYNGYGMALCPFHNDHSPSLRVTDKGYYCLSGCGGGSLEKLLKTVSGKVVLREKTYNPAGAVWGRWSELFGSVNNIAKVAYNDLHFNPDLGKYLQDRKIDSQIEKGKIGFLDGYYTFPIRNEYEKVVGIVARASPTIESKMNRYTVSDDCPEHLYVPNWERTLKDEEVYVCYGTVDVWTLEMCELPAVTGLSGQEFRPEYLDRFRKRIYVIPDKGEEKRALKIQQSMGWRAYTLFIDFPEGTKDLNGIHMEYGIDTVSKLVQEAKERYIYAE